jgi:hypothetical protein
MKNILNHHREYFCLIINRKKNQNKNICIHCSVNFKVEKQIWTFTLSCGWSRVIRYETNIFLSNLCALLKIHRKRNFRPNKSHHLYDCTWGVLVPLNPLLQTVPIFSNPAENYTEQLWKPWKMIKWTS